MHWYLNQKFNFLSNLYNFQICRYGPILKTRLQNNNLRTAKFVLLQMFLDKKEKKRRERLSKTSCLIEILYRTTMPHALVCMNIMLSRCTNV